MPERRYLDEVDLTGARHVIRELIHVGIAVSVVVATVGFFLPAVRPYDFDFVHNDAPFESYYASGGYWLLVTIWFVVLHWLRTRGRGYGVGYKLGLVATLLPVLGIVPLSSLMMRNLEHVAGHHVFWGGIAGIIGLGLLAIVGELVLHIAERRHIERDVDPEFPTARVV